jgi:8-oxo-dGTP pyrophosphatase MutT (NUDIX family)
MDSDARAFKQRVKRILDGRTRQSLEEPALKCAAVLIPLLYKKGEWHVLVTQRTQTVAHHKGQISFPGGACEPGDGDLMTTALRETHEEIGVAPNQVEVLGALDDFGTVTSFIVTPFVGVIPSPFEYRLNKDEVEATIEVPLSFFENPEHLRVEPREHQGRIYDVLYWDYGPYTIWGATASMLRRFLDLVGT